MNPKPTEFALLAATMLTALMAPASAADEPEQVSTKVADAQGFETIARPFFKEYSAKCHSGPEIKGDFSVSPLLSNDFSDLAAQEQWREVVNVLNSHDMPPSKEKQPTAPQVAQVVDWIIEQTVRADLVRRDRSVSMRRLNRNEYRNMIRDLVGVDFDVAAFPQDPGAGGFDNNGRALTMSPFQMEL